MKKQIFRTLILCMALFLTLAPMRAQAYTYDELVTAENLDYDYIERGSEGYFRVVKNGKCGLINETGIEVATPKYDYMEEVSDGMVVIGMDVDGNSNTGTSYSGMGIDKYGFIDVNGKEIVPPIYDSVEKFSEGFAVVGKQYQYIDDTIFKGAVITATKYGFIDKTGKECIPLIYDEIFPKADETDKFTGIGSMKYGFNEGLASVRKNGKAGVIDTKGNTIIPFIYDSLSGFSEGFARACKNGKSGFIDRQGKVVIPFIYDGADDFSEGFAVVSKFDSNSYTGLLRGVIDKQGKQIVPMVYESISRFSNGRALVGKSGASSRTTWKFGYIDTTGKLVIPMIYDDALDFSEGLARVGIEDKRFDTAYKFIYGFIDKQGIMVVPMKYDEAGSFSEGLALVGINVSSPAFDSPVKFNTPAQYGYIDRTGNMAMPFGQIGYGYDNFTDGFSLTTKNGEYAIIKNPLSSEKTTVETKRENSKFLDVPSNAYYAIPINWAVEQGITNGTDAYNFSPNSTCTTAQILTFLWRANGSPEPTIKNPFNDVSNGEYYTKAALWAYEKGLISGEAFAGATPCTRSMVVTYLWKLAGKPNGGANIFSDVSNSADYVQAVTWAVSKGITGGTGNNKFSPDTICTRGQIVTFLYRNFAK